MFSNGKILLKTNGFVAVGALVGNLQQEEIRFMHQITYIHPSVKTEQEETNGDYGRANKEKYRGHTNGRRRNTLNTEFLPFSAEELKLAAVGLKPCEALGPYGKYA